MNRATMTLAMVGLVTVAASSARADQPGADWMPADRVKAHLMKEGYTSITSFEADDGHWEGQGVKGGQKMQFHADPETGRLLSEKPNH